MNKTTKVSDVVAVADRIPDGDMIVTAHIAGRTVRINAVVEGKDGVSMRCSHRDWPNAQYFDVEDGTEFQMYTAPQYAAMLDAVRQQEG